METLNKIHKEFSERENSFAWIDRCEILFVVVFETGTFYRALAVPVFSV